MKISLFSLVALLAYPIFAQVGIGTESPQVTLDIKATSSDSTADGVVAPHLSKLMLASKTSGTYSSDQIGAIVFVNDVSGTISGQSLLQTANISEPGYYFFDGNLWQPFAKLQSVSASSPITADTQNGVATIGINRKNMNTAIGSAIATSPITISGGNANSTVGNSDITVAVNNDAPLFNANKLNGVNIITPNSSNLLNGHTLTYDATAANWTYKYPALQAIPGVLAPTNTRVGNSNSSMVYTGAYIDLPKGKWMIHLGSTIGIVNFNSTSNSGIPLTAGSIWVTFTIQDSSTGSSETTTADHITSYSGRRAAAATVGMGGFKTFVSGSFAVDNTSDSPNGKRYFVWMQQDRTGVSPSNLVASGAFHSEAWERYFYAIPIQ